MRIALHAFTLAASLFAFSAGASRIVPPEPIAFEAVNLRMTVDGCAFVPETVHVRAVGHVLKVTQHMNQCFAPGPLEIADVRLGSLAPGEYRVEVYASPDAVGPPVETLAFEVRTRPEILIFPPPPRPITDYSGMWWNAAESGWGLLLHQSPTDVMFGAPRSTAPRVPSSGPWFSIRGGCSCKPWAPRPSIFTRFPATRGAHASPTAWTAAA